jgi:hypothetical protein
MVIHSMVGNDIQWIQGGRGEGDMNKLTSCHDFVSFNHLNRKDDVRECPGLGKVKKERKEKKSMKS